MKKQEFKKNEERFWNLWDNFKHSNIQIIGVPEGVKEEQEIENLLEQIMKKNFSNLAKEIDFQEVQEVQSPTKLDPKRNTPRHIIIKLPKIKDKETIFLKNFYCYLVTVVCIFSPSLHPIPAKPTSLPHLHPPP